MRLVINIWTLSCQGRELSRILEKANIKLIIAISILIDNYDWLLLYEMKNLKPILLKYFNNDSKEYALPIWDSIHNISNHEKSIYFI